jgi:endoglucanase
MSRQTPLERFLTVVAGATVLVVLASSMARAACVETRHTVPAVRLEALARGFNLAGQLDGTSSALLHEDLLRALYSRGMRHVRLPIPAETVMSGFSTKDAVERQLQTLARFVGQLVDIGYAVTVDLHPGAQFQNMHRDKPAEALAALKDAWQMLARVVGRFPPDKVFAELLNEPDVGAERWQSEMRQLAEFVRKLLPDTTLIVGPVNWQRADSLPHFKPLDDRNVVYAIHFYDPMAFTHQGHWDRNDPLSEIRQLPFPLNRNDATVMDLRAMLQAAEKSAALRALEAALAMSDQGDVVARQLEPALSWQAEYRRPLIINEFGVLTHHAPPASRIQWLRAVVSFAEANCIGWTHWEFAQGFGLLNDKKQLDEQAVRALLRR